MQIEIAFLPAYAAAFMLMFARIGTMVMLLPALGEISVPVRIRLVSALVLTLVLFPLHRAAFQVDLRSFAPVVLLLGQELVIGAVLGGTVRLAMSGLQVAGTIVANQLGLGFVTAVDPTQNQQGVILGNFLTLLGVVLLFATDLHHTMIAALSESYALFHPGEMPFAGDVAKLTIETIATSFRIGVQLSAPFLVFGLIFNIGLGVLSRLMPQMQVFFVGMPLTIMIGLVILLLVVGSMMGSFISYFDGVLGQLVPPRQG
jgi:flagellar biosynthesis protein FliR